MPQKLSQFIEAPVETVFACVADPELQKQYNPDFVQIIYPEGHDPDRVVGEKFVYHFRQGGQIQQALGETIAFEPPEHLAVRMEAGMWTVLIDYRFESVPGGAEVHLEVDTKFHSGFLRFLSGLLGMAQRKDLRRRLQTLKEFAERIAQSPMDTSE
ncbi:MAG: SRPBCC family protein [Planctomycetaceae bacterium]|nr:SRPBCC family protein [Planctomycetaceae bacterium]